MSAKYKINRDFVPREPTGADMFAYCTLEEFSDQLKYETFEKMREAGARSFRITIVSDEYPNDPYPHGYWFEGWKDRFAKHLPFGEGRPDDNTISPPLTLERNPSSPPPKNSA